MIKMLIKMIKKLFHHLHYRRLITMKKKKLLNRLHTIDLKCKVMPVEKALINDHLGVSNAS